MTSRRIALTALGALFVGMGSANAGKANESPESALAGWLAFPTEYGERPASTREVAVIPVTILGIEKPVQVHVIEFRMRNGSYGKGFVGAKTYTRRNVRLIGLAGETFQDVIPATGERDANISEIGSMRDDARRSGGEGTEEAAPDEMHSGAGRKTLREYAWGAHWGPKPIRKNAGCDTLLA